MLSPEKLVIYVLFLLLWGVGIAIWKVILHTKKSNTQKLPLVELFNLEIIEKGEPEGTVSVQMVSLKDRERGRHKRLRLLEQT